MHFRVVLITLSLTALIGCVAPPTSTTALRQPSRTRKIAFDRDFLFTGSKPGNIQRYTGFLAGTFEAAYEDNEGIYYRGHGPSVVWADDPVGHIQFLADGGVWISKTSGSRHFKIFRIIGTEIERSTDTGAIAEYRHSRKSRQPSTDGQFIANQVEAGVSPAVAGVGYAIGMAIIDNLIELDQGKIKFNRDDPPTNIELEGAYREVIADK